MSKIRVALLFGGRSAEHEVSIRSAQTVFNALDKSKYDVTPIAIARSGKWLAGAESLKLLGSETDKGTQALSVTDSLNEVASSIRTESKFDVVIPLIHGTYGEDGSLQGFLRMMDLPYVGPDVLGSSVCMDKDVAKRLLLQAGIPCAPFACVESHKISKLDLDKIISELKLPLFVKPSNLGSSVGISKANSKAELIAALKLAAEYDRKILIEQFIKCREIECSVLGNEEPEASIPGEILPQAEFYSYDAKYSSASKSEVRIPAEIPAETAKRVRELAVQAFKVLGCEGMARVDFFLEENGKLWLNELNTIPGFTSISMYPKMWEASGLPLPKLLDKLIELAVSRYERDKKFKVTT